MYHQTKNSAHSTKNLGRKITIDTPKIRGDSGSCTQKLVRISKKTHRREWMTI